MGKGLIFVYSNPVSPEKEDEYNAWGNGVHADELLEAPSVRSVSRYKVSDTQLPGVPSPDYRYLCVYELDDLDRGFREMHQIFLRTTPSDAIDPARTLSVKFEEVHDYRK
jgi:hypothetical protein